MDTNDKSGATPGPGQAEKGTQNRPAAGAGPRRAQPPKMDGVSAGGRPQRPVPRTGPAPNQKPAGPQTGKQRPQRPAQSQAENAEQIEMDLGSENLPDSDEPLSPDAQDYRPVEEDDDGNVIFEDGNADGDRPEGA